MSTDPPDGYELELAGGVSVPLPARLGEWLSDLLAIPRGLRWTIFTTGVLCGLLIALAAFIAGLYLAYS